MQTTKRLLKATLALLLLAGCSNEELVRQTDGSLFGNVPEGMIEYQFKLTGITPTTSYANASYADVAAIAKEMAVYDMEVAVFQEFEADAPDETAQNAAPILLGATASIKNNIASILIPKDDLTKLKAANPDAKALRFILFANTQLTTSRWSAWYPGAKNTKVADQTYGSLVKDIYSAWLIAEDGGHIAGSPYKNRSGLPMYAIVKNEPMPEEGDVLNIKPNTKLKRSVARLDIRNSAIKYLTIENIGIGNCRTVGSLFDPTRFVDFDEDLRFMSMSNTFDAVNNLNDVDLKDAVTGEMPYEEGMFYPHPSKADDELLLVLQGKVILNGVTQPVSYTLPLQGGPLEANKRYRLDITMNDRGEIEAIMDFGIDDWGEGAAADGSDTDILHRVVQPIINDANLAVLARNEYRGSVGVESYEISFMGGNGTEVILIDEDYTDAVNVFLNAVEKPKTRGTNLRTWTITTKVGATGTAYFRMFDPTNGGGAEFPNGYPLEKMSIRIPSEDMDMELSWPMGDGKEAKAYKIGNTIWAPANLGAKTNEELGGLYQWGISYGYEIHGIMYWNTEAIDVKNGGARTEYDKWRTRENYYFMTNSEGENSYPQWLAEDYVRVKAWNPCPTGWRIPTHEECTAMHAAYSSYNYDGTTKILTLTNNTDGSTFKMPAGQLAAILSIEHPGNAEVSSDDYTTAGFWTKWTTGDNPQVSMFSYNTITLASPAVVTTVEANSYPVRCVKSAAVAP